MGHTVFVVVEHTAGPDAAAGPRQREREREKTLVCDCGALIKTLWAPAPPSSRHLFATAKPAPTAASRPLPALQACTWPASSTRRRCCPQTCAVCPTPAVLTSPVASSLPCSCPPSRHLLAPCLTFRSPCGGMLMMMTLNEHLDPRCVLTLNLLVFSHLTTLDDIVY